MQYRKGISRLVIGVVIVVLIIVAGLVYYFGFYRPAAVAGPTKVELTGDFEKDVVEVGKALLANGVNEVRFSVWSGGDPNSVMRVLGIVEAAHRINKIWEENGLDIRIVIVESRYDRNPKAIYEEYLSKQPIGQAPDFFVNSYVYIAELANEGYILDITEYASKYQDLLNDFYPALLEVMKWNGRLYGLPQDTEARPLYIRKDVAACAGLDLTDLATKVKNGEFTWYDVYQWAKQAVDKGCAEWGVIHRKGSAHPDLIQFIYAFGGRLYDEDKNKLVLDKEAVYKWLYVEWKMARDGLIPENMMEWDWGQQIHPSVVNGKTLFFIGGVWHWTEWQTREYYVDPVTKDTRGLRAEEVKEYFYYILFPAGESGKSPVTLSQPYAWMINSRVGERNPKYAELKELYRELAFLVIVKASDPDINAIHSIISAHLPVRRAAAELIKNEAWLEKLKNLEIELSEEVKNKIKDIVLATVNPINTEFLANVEYMLEYTRITPMHPLYPKLAEIFKEAVDKVLRGDMTPEEAVNYIISKINADIDLKENTEIVGEIPTGWSYP